jgi:hypothetical protein
VLLQRLPWPAPYQAWVINAMAAVETWWRRDGWRYNIVSAATPISDRDTVRSVAPVAAPEARCLALGTSLREVEVETWDAIRSRRNVPSYLWRAGGRALSELP